MKIVIGSLNETKINAVKKVFPEANLSASSVPSGVSLQPVGDEETYEGAVNRAKHAQERYPNHIGIGLEGGVMKLKHDLYVCNWGALATTEGDIYVASGARIKLPRQLQRKSMKGLN